MRIAVVSHSAGLGGAELCLLELLTGLEGGEHDVTVVLPAAGPLAARIEQLGAPTTVLPHGWWATVGRRPGLRELAAHRHLAGAGARLLRMLEEHSSEVVLTNSAATPLGAIAARRAGIPHVWWVHELGHAGHLRFHLGEERSYRLVARMSNRVLAPSGAVESFLLERSPGLRVRKVDPAVLVPPEHGCSEAMADDPFTILVLGSITERKGQLDAVRALAHLARRGVPASLTMVGDGPEAHLSRLRGEARRLGVSAGVRHEPHHDGATAWFKGSHVVLTCSRAEAFGRVPVEAMKCRRPVVGARSGATPELIGHGATGLLYEPGDTSDLADQLERLYREPALRASLTASAHRWATERFNLQRHTATVLDELGGAVG